MQVALGPGHTVLDGTQFSLPQRHRCPIFGTFLLWPNGWMHQDATWYGGRSQPTGLCVRWGPSPLPRKGREPTPRFSAHFYCGQTAGCIKMPFSMEVGLSPGDFVFDGDPAPFPPKGCGAPLPSISGFVHAAGFAAARRCLRFLVLDQDGTWHGGRPWSRC